ncbi:MAG: ABC transporter permease [Nitriliruptoraceae bacterium]|nr:ABC transporter permease [Nitriliruptoraceae bacterium]
MGYVTEFITQGSVQDQLVTETLNHLALSLVPIGVAMVIGLGLGVAAHRVPSLRGPIVRATSALLTIPSLALFALFVPLVGIGNNGPLIALALYALLPIVRNTVAGLQAVDDAVIESATATGMSATRRLWTIELPNAWPVMLAGVRLATLLVVGLAATAVLVGGDGYGVLIYLEGIQQLGSPGAFEYLVTGVLLVVAMAVVLDLLYTLIGRLTIPRGLRD